MQQYTSACKLSSLLDIGPNDETPCRRLRCKDIHIENI